MKTLNMVKVVVVHQYHIMIRSVCVCVCVCVCVLNSWLLTAKDVRVYAERLRLFERGDGGSEFSHVKRGGSASSPRAFSYALPMRNAITS